MSEKGTKLSLYRFNQIMQDFALVSDYTVFQNVEIPLLYGTAVKAADSDGSHVCISRFTDIG